MQALLLIDTLLWLCCTAVLPDVGEDAGGVEPPPPSPAVEIQVMLRQLPKNGAESCSECGPAPWHTISMVLSPAHTGGSAALAQLATGGAAAGSSGGRHLAGPPVPAVHAPATPACIVAAPSDAREGLPPSCMQPEGRAAAVAEVAGARAGAGVCAVQAGAVEAAAGAEGPVCAAGTEGGMRQAASAMTSGSHQHPQQLSSLALGPVMPLSQLVWQFGASSSDNSSSRATAGSAKQRGGGEDGEEVSSSGVSQPGPCQSQGSCRPAAGQLPHNHTSMVPPPPAMAAALRDGGFGIQKPGGWGQHAESPARPGASISQRLAVNAAGPAFSWGDPSIMPAAVLAAHQWYGSSGMRRKLLNSSHQQGQQDRSSLQQQQRGGPAKLPAAEQWQVQRNTAALPLQPVATALLPPDRQGSSEARVSRPASPPRSASSSGPGQLGVFSWGDPTLLMQPGRGITPWHGTNLAQDPHAAAVVASSGLAPGWVHHGAGGLQACLP